MKPVKPRSKKAQTNLSQEISSHSILFTSNENMLPSSLKICFSGMHPQTLIHMFNLLPKESISEYMGDIVVSSDCKPTCILLLVLLRGGAVVSVEYVYQYSQGIPDYREYELSTNKHLTLSDRPNNMMGIMTGAKVVLDTFPGSSSHPIIADELFPKILQLLGAIIVDDYMESTYIISDRSVASAASTIFKKIDFNWIVDSIVGNRLQQIDAYIF